MNSPAVIVTHYQSKNYQLSSPGTQELCRNNAGLRLLSPAWQLPLTCSQRVTPNRTPVAASPADVNETMDQYWNLVFEFTYPFTVDFRDIQTGELASTRDSLMVFEYGQGLCNTLEALQNMRVEPNLVETLERSIQKVEASLEDLRVWIEDQQAQQLLDENTKLSGWCPE
ncbi:hypothetical protein FRC12_008278 [Ceratobasidium sp. 428]|nr:hypothetical protein FRC12_008278 [Ceratobasidium sp. 428]